MWRTHSCVPRRHSCRRPVPTPYTRDSMDSINTQLRVRYAETDQMGVVYHANYIIWMEVGRVEYFRARGIRYRDMERDAGILLVVVEAHCRYHSPARYDEEVTIRTWLEDANARMIVFGYEMTDSTTGC